MQTPILPLIRRPLRHRRVGPNCFEYPPTPLAVGVLDQTSFSKGVALRRVLFVSADPSGRRRARTNGLFQRAALRRLRFLLPV